MDVPTGMRSQKFKDYCSETFRVEARCLDWMSRQIELGLVDVAHQAKFSREDTYTLVVFINLWTQNLAQRVWISIKALLGALRGKIQQKVEASAIEVGFVGSLLDAAANQQRRRAPSEAITRTDVHDAARAMGVDVLLDLSELWCKNSFDINGLPHEVVDRFASRYLLSLGHGVPREVAAGEARQGGAGKEYEQEVPAGRGRALHRGLGGG